MVDTLVVHLAHTAENLDGILDDQRQLKSATAYLALSMVRVHWL